MYKYVLLFIFQSGIICLIFNQKHGQINAQVGSGASLDNEKFASSLAKEQKYLFKIDSLEKAGSTFKLMGYKNDIAWLYTQHLHDTDKAKKYNQEVLDHIEMNNDSLWHGAYSTSLTLKAIIQTHEGLNSSGLQTHFKALKIKEVENDTGRISFSYLQIGKTLAGLKRYDDALIYFFKSKYLRDKMKKPNPKLTQLIGTTYRRLNQLEESKNYYELSLQEARQRKIRIMEGTTMAHLAEVYYLENNYTKALELLEESLTIRSGILRPVQKIDVLLTFTKTFIGLNKMDQARKYGLEAYQLAIDYNSLVHQRSCLKELINISEALEESKKELDYYKLYEATVDSLYNMENLRLTIDHQTMYESQEKEKKILEQKIEISTQRTEKNILSIILVLLSALGIIGFILFRNRLKYQRRINEKDQLIKDQEIQKLNQQHKYIALNSLMQGQEHERQRIAGDLHDGLGGLLTNIKAHFHAVDIKVDKKDGVYYKMNNLIDEACSEVRKIARNMTPNALKISGFTGAIEDIKRQLQIHGIDCSVEIDDEFENAIDEKTSLILYRIIQESINNIQKHADAGQVLIQAFSHEENLSILIEDDGIGFDIIQARKKEGLGLVSLESRVKFLNGTIQFDSIEGRGTTIIIEIPKNQ